MINLLRLEFRKLSRQRSLYICSAIIVAMLLISALTFRIAANFDFGNPEINALIAQNGLKFLLNSFDNGNLILILGIVVAIAFCSDFEEGTIKNIFARGYSRTSLYFSKLISIFFSATIIYLIAMVSAFIIGLLFFGMPSDIDILKTLALIGIQYILVLAHTAFFIFISSLFRKMGGAIAVNIVAPIIILLVLALIDQLIKINGFTFTEMWMSSLLTSMGNSLAETSKMIVALISGIIYSIVFIFLGLTISKKVEL